MLTAHLARYLYSLHLIRAAGGGTKVTSYYAPLETLFNSIGRSLEPRVTAVSQLVNTGRGHPDLVLYAVDQLSRGDLKAG